MVTNMWFHPPLFFKTWFQLGVLNVCIYIYVYIYIYSNGYIPINMHLISFHESPFIIMIQPLLNPSILDNVQGKRYSTSTHSVRFYYQHRIPLCKHMKKHYIPSHIPWIHPFFMVFAFGQCSKSLYYSIVPLNPGWLRTGNMIIPN